MNLKRERWIRRRLNAELRFRRRRGDDRVGANLGLEIECAVDD